MIAGLNLVRSDSLLLQHQQLSSVLHELGVSQEMRIPLLPRLLLPTIHFVAPVLLKMALTLTGKSCNGWNDFDQHLRNQSSSPLLRAAVAIVGVGANVPRAIMYRISSPFVALYGKHPRKMVFEQLPPVGEWSITVIQDTFLSRHSHNISIGSQSKLVRRVGGTGYEVWLQPDPPDDSAHVNWLSVPREGTYQLTARFYNPSRQLIDGEWVLPELKLLR